jgi:hypothetical protein
MQLRLVQGHKLSGRLGYVVVFDCRFDKILDCATETNAECRCERQTHENVFVSKLLPPRRLVLVNRRAVFTWYSTRLVSIVTFDLRLC